MSSPLSANRFSCVGGAGGLGRLVASLASQLASCDGGSGKGWGKRRAPFSNNRAFPAGNMIMRQHEDRNPAMFEGLGGAGPGAAGLSIRGNDDGVVGQTVDEAVASHRRAGGKASVRTVGSEQTQIAALQGGRPATQGLLQAIGQHPHRSPARLRCFVGAKLGARSGDRLHTLARQQVFLGSVKPPP